MFRAVTIATLLSFFSGCGLAGASVADDAPGSIVSGGITRDYWVHVPASYDATRPTALVLVFHGGGGEARGMARLSGMDDVSDRHGFIAVYPQGIDRQWKDGRTQALSGNDDVAFISSLIAALETRYRIDPNRVYATGISNGAFFSFRLACDLGGEIAAIAPVAGSIPVGFHDACKNQPVSVMMINGTDDKLVMFDGGRVGGPFVDQGDSIPVAQTLADWLKVDGCRAPANETTLRDADPLDGTTTLVQAYGGCRNGAAVQLYTIEGGGHTWPDGPQYLPKSIIGNVSHDFDASEVIWQFFASHPAR
jgi:polyhydroxybutyrate depolymerase